MILYLSRYSCGRMLFTCFFAHLNIGWAVKADMQANVLLLNLTADLNPPSTNISSYRV